MIGEGRRHLLRKFALLIGSQAAAKRILANLEKAGYYFYLYNGCPTFYILVVFKAHIVYVAIRLLLKAWWLNI